MTEEDTGWTGFAGQTLKLSFIVFMPKAVKIYAVPFSANKESVFTDRTKH